MSINKSDKSHKILFKKHTPRLYRKHIKLLRALYFSEKSLAEKGAFQMLIENGKFTEKNPKSDAYAEIKKIKARRNWIDIMLECESRKEMLRYLKPDYINSSTPSLHVQ